MELVGLFAAMASVRLTQSATLVHQILFLPAHFAIGLARKTAAYVKWLLKDKI